MKFYSIGPLLLSGVFGSGQLCAQQLEEIVVSAEFRPVNLLEQAASTSVVTHNDIRQRAAQHLEEILNITPNVNSSGGTARARFYQIRGIGERSQFQEPVNPSIGFIIDGVDFSGLGTVGTLFDVEQVEVLRGPQGTLHGANALAGLINIRSAVPEEVPAFSIEGGAGNYNSWNAGVTATGPLITDTLLYRIAAHQYRSDGFIENDYLNRDDTQDRDEASVRTRLRWLASGQSTVDISLFYADIDNGYDAFSLNNTRHTLSDEPGKDRQESTALSLSWHIEMSGFRIETLLSAANSDTQYSYDEDWVYVGYAPDQGEYSSFDSYLRDRDSYSAQLRLLSNESSRLFNDRGDWAAGFYYLGNREDLQRQNTYLAEDFFSHYDTDTYALFGQLDTRLSERVKLISGLRFEQRETNYSDNNDVRSDPDKTLWGGRLVLKYQLAEQYMFYGGISRGYRANGINAGILASMNIIDDPAVLDQMRKVQTYDEESLLNYEAGFKGQFFDNSVSIRLALFYMDRKDQQVKGSLVVQRPDESYTFFDHTNNAADGSNYGLELEVDWLVSEHLSLYTHLGLLEAEFDDYHIADGSDLSGRDQAQAPHYQYAMGGRYGFGSGFYLRLDIEGRDEFYFSDRHNLKAPSYNLLHLRAGYAADNWEIALWSRNLGDEDYFVRGFGSFGNNPRKDYVVEPYMQYGDPRQLGISARYSF
ncbi:MAG: TonB-dependent receptor [Parahaliea sp.]